MANLETIVQLAKDILSWFDTVKDTEISQKKIAYLLSHNAEAFYEMSLPELFVRSEKVRGMQLSLMTARHCIHDTTPAGEVRAVIATSSIIDGLKEIVVLSEEPYETVQFLDSPQLDIYGSPDNSKVIVFEDKDNIGHYDQSQREALLNNLLTSDARITMIPHLPLINLHANKGPAVPGFADFDGDVLKAYRLTMTCPIKRGPGKGRTRVVSRFISVFNQ